MNSAKKGLKQTALKFPTMSGFERKTLEDGQPNPKYVDLCDQDPPIHGQKFVCLSFVSPEHLLKQREMFMFEQFLKQFEFRKSMDKLYEFIQFLSVKYPSLDLEELTKDYEDFIREEGVKLREQGIEDDFKNFMDKNEDELTKRFQSENKFQTSVRGLKVRGAFESIGEAEIHAKEIREMDPHHDVFVGQVGAWMPWHPDAYKTGRIEFMEEQLNQLHTEKLKNEAKAKAEFEKRVRDAKRKAIEENIKKAQASGNVLTQTIDENDNLIGVTQTVNFDEREAVTEEEIKQRNLDFVKSKQA
jgi:hypothetical protein